MLKILLLAILMTTFTTLTTLQVTKAYFTDSATSTGNTFTAASEFAPLTSAQLKINEFSSLGDSDLEWVEIFNPTNSSVDISGWKITDGVGPADTIPTISPIPANGYAVIIGSTNTTASIPGSAISAVLTNPTIGNGLNNLGDTIRLRNAADTEIDALSYGTDTSIFTAPAPVSTQTLRRIPNGTDTDTGTDWQLGTSSIGVSN